METSGMASLSVFSDPVIPCCCNSLWGLWDALLLLCYAERSQHGKTGEAQRTKVPLGPFFFIFSTPLVDDTVLILSVVKDIVLLFCSHFLTAIVLQRAILEE